jgi:hypothetical protein
MQSDRWAVPARRRLAALAALFGILAAPAATSKPTEGADSGGPPQADALEALGADTDPTKPVFFGIREEYYDLPDDRWQNLALLRVDGVLGAAHPGGRPRGVLLRGDLPLATFDDGFGTTTGLGDLYGQALLFPGFPSSRLLVGVGTGLVLPTATDEVLGRGKWIAAPVVAPVWIFPRRGLAYLKVQDWISFAGDGERPDLHYLTVTPTLLWRLSPRWWTVVDAESTSDWELDGQTSFRVGLALGRMLSPRYGLSLKAELPFGGHPQTDWTLKAVFFATRF